MKEVSNLNIYYRQKSSAVIKAFSETAITLFKNLALNDVLLLEGTIFTTII